MYIHGIIYCIVLTCRAKEELKRETDPFKKKMLEGRQLALDLLVLLLVNFPVLKCLRFVILCTPYSILHTPYISYVCQTVGKVLVLYK